MTRRPLPTPADQVAWPIAAALCDCIRTALRSAIGGSPASCCIIPGRDVAIDDCCAGQAWVRIVRVYPTLPGEFPNPRPTPLGAGCDDGACWAVELGAGTARCAPGQDDAGLPPSDAAQELAARVLADDASRIRRAVLCCLPAVDGVEEIVVGEQSSAGPSGGCVGQELLVTVMTSICVCEEARA